MKRTDCCSSSKWFRPRAHMSRGNSFLDGHDGRQALRFDFFEPIIMLFNLNETTIKRLLELKMESWDFNTPRLVKCRHQTALIKVTATQSRRHD